MTTSLPGVMLARFVVCMAMLTGSMAAAMSDGHVVWDADEATDAMGDVVGVTACVVVAVMFVEFFVAVVDAEVVAAASAHHAVATGVVRCTCHAVSYFETVGLCAFSQCDDCSRPFVSEDVGELLGPKARIFAFDDVGVCAADHGGIYTAEEFHGGRRRGGDFVY